MKHYYEEVEGWFSDVDARFYNYLVDKVPNGGSIVEIGTWKGRSLSCLLVEAKNIEKQLEITGVDTFKGTPGEDCYSVNGDIFAMCRENADRAGYPYRLVCKPSVEASADFADESLDAVFIDGDHSREAVLADLNAWAPKLKKGGILAGHDVICEGVLMALNDFFQGDIKVNLIGECWFCRKV